MFSSLTGNKKTPPAPAAAASLKDDASSLRRYDLKGYERSFTISPTGCTRLAHIMTLQGPPSRLALLRRHVVPALLAVMRQHAKMRARISQDDLLVAEILPAMDLTEEDVVQRLVTLQPYEASTKEQRLEEIRALVQDTCNQTVDRTTQFPYFLVVLYENNQSTDATAAEPKDGAPLQSCTLLLFSDHAFSDVTSGMVVLNDLLTHLRTLMLEQPLASLPEFPLRPPLYDSLRPPPTLWQRGTDALITSFGENNVIPSIANFLPVVSARDGDEIKDINGLPLPHNPSFCYLHAGSTTTTTTTSSYLAAKAKCASEQVSLTSAITASLVLAYSKMAGAPYAFSTTPVPKFMLSLDLQYDMRSRIKTPYPETTVGCNIFCANQEALSETGLDLQALDFWKVAHVADTCAESTVSSFNAMAEYIYTHHKFHANVKELKLKAHKSIMSDVSLSHVEYPYPTTLGVSAGGDAITIQGLHVYHSMPNAAYGAIVFITVINDTFHYTLMSKLSDDDSKRLLQYIVQAVEGIAEMKKGETMLQAAERLYGA